MKKTLALLLVASLLLAGCTELSSSDDGETEKIEINEDIAIEKIDEFLTVDEDETFGIMMSYEIDPGMMGLETEDEDSTAVVTIEMTEAWSPSGYYAATSMGIGEDGLTYSMTQSRSHIDTNIYIKIAYGYEGDFVTLSDAELEALSEEDRETYEEEKMEHDMIVAMSEEPTHYKMRSAQTHTEVIASMAEETGDSDDGMDMMAMLEFFTYVECMTTYTPADSVDGLQIYDVGMENMEEDSITPELALCMFDTDNSNSISFEEFENADESPDGDELDEARTVFDESDSNNDGELTSDELETFIAAMNAIEDDHDHDHDHDEMDDDDDMDTMPEMSVAFNDAGEIEYFSMTMSDPTMEGSTVMKMYVLSEDDVAPYFAVSSEFVEATWIALPFTIVDELDPWGSGDMFDDDDYDDDDRHDHDHDDDHDDDDRHDHGGHDDHDGDHHDDHGDDHDDDHHDYPTFICGDGEEIPFDFVNDGEADCDDGADEQQYDSNDEPINWFDCMDGTQVWIYEVNDGVEDCSDGDDEMPDSDDDGTSIVHPTFVCGDGTEIPFEYVNDNEEDCDDGADEQQYDSDGNEINWYDCMDGSVVWLYVVNDGFADCPDGDDEMPDRHDDDHHDDDHDDDHDGDHHDGHDDHGDDRDDDHDGGHHGGHGGGDDGVYYVTIEEMDFDFEGVMSDYAIVLANCVEEYDDEAMDFSMSCGESVMTVSVSDAVEGSTIEFVDADESGTISIGDEIHVGDVSEDWNTVRLYSASADGYSDESTELLKVPGFTGLVGMLALLGAAFIRRND